MTYADMSDRQLRKWMKDNPVKTELSYRDRLVKKSAIELKEMLVELKTHRNPAGSFYIHPAPIRGKINDVEWAIHEQILG